MFAHALLDRLEYLGSANLRIGAGSSTMDEAHAEIGAPQDDDGPHYQGTPYGNVGRTMLDSRW